ncbi:hypothetical protein SKAU_G00406930 [Synaphobranchus kaupii]|uniref:Uncharacterized protein n=1 Tax=Synaphobranchus kaupii TaxID=118154 RepID=A0A9Q1ICW9_SYNKA|nr:hypothetical protein SKAU_G00406930 [Synaphobranchus kaupii]
MHWRADRRGRIISDLETGRASRNASVPASPTRATASLDGTRNAAGVSGSPRLPAREYVNGSRINTAIGSTKAPDLQCSLIYR